jgi:GAF domain-containing protein
LTRAVVEISDVLEDVDYAVTAELLAGGFRSVLSVPLMRDGAPIGAISVGRTEVGSFPAEQIALLQTFADQAVIAIENVRLFNELKDAHGAADAFRRASSRRLAKSVRQSVRHSIWRRCFHDRLARRPACGMDGGSIWNMTKRARSFICALQTVCPRAR